MTDAEKEVMEKLVVFWNSYVTLSDSSDTDNKSVLNAVHAIQAILAIRVARRANPEIWK